MVLWPVRSSGGVWNREAISRRRLLQMAGSAAVLGLDVLSGEGRGAAAPATRLVWLTHPVFDDVTRDLLGRYKQETGTEVILDKVPYPGLREKAYLELSSGSDRYDLVSITQDLWTWDINSRLEPLDALMRDFPPEAPSDINERLLSMFRGPDRKLYGWPIRSGVFIVHYRKDLYDEFKLSPPRTWDEYKFNARALNKPPERYGNFIMGTQDQFAFHDWQNYFFNFGGKLLSPDHRRCLINSEQGLRATEYWLSFVKEGLVPPGAASAKWDDEISAMQQGLAAQTIGWSPYAIPINDPSKSKYAGKFGWAVAPFDPRSGLRHSETFLTCWGVFIPRATRNKAAAFTFLSWLTNRTNDLLMALRGNGPVRNSTYAQSLYLQMNPAAPATVEALKYGNPGLPPLPRRPEITVLINQELNAGVSGKKSPKQVVDDITSGVNRLLAS